VPLGPVSLTDYITNPDVVSFFRDGKLGSMAFSDIAKMGVFEFPNFFSKEQCEELFHLLEDGRDQTLDPDLDPKFAHGWLVSHAIEDHGKLLDFLREGISVLFGAAIANQLTRVYAFVLNYDIPDEPTEEMKLAMAPHKDDCLVTLNVCLWSDPEETAEVIFWGQQPSQLYPKKVRSTKSADLRNSIMHNSGKAILHRGAQIHEVKHHSGNRRRNLVMYLLADDITHLLNRVILST
jgi:hypothetical protein